MCGGNYLQGAKNVLCESREHFLQRISPLKKGRSIAFSKAIVSKQMVNERLKQLELAFKRQMFQVLVDFSCHIICWKMTSSDITQLYAHKVLFFQFQQLNCNYKTLKYDFISNYHLFHGIFEKTKLNLLLLKQHTISQWKW